MLHLTMGQWKLGSDDDEWKEPDVYTKPQFRAVGKGM